MSRDIEIMVNAVSEMTQCLELIQRDYLRMQNIIKIERDLIAKRDLDAHEGQVKQKTSVGSSIVERAEKMMSLWRRIKTMTAPTDLNKPQEVTTLSDLISHIQAWINGNEGSDVSLKILTHAVEKLKNRLDSFADIRKSVNPEIEANAYLVERLLKRHRDFRRFIQHEIDGSSSVYNAKGFQSSKDPLPMLRVRA